MREYIRSNILLVLSQMSGMGHAVTRFCKRINPVRNVSYSVTLNWIRC